MMGTYDTLLLAFDMDNRVDEGVAQAIIRSAIDFKRDPWPKVSDNAKDLVKKRLNLDPKQRLTTQEVLGNLLTWLQNAKKAPNVPLGKIVKARLKQFSVMNKVKKRALRVLHQQGILFTFLEIGCIHLNAI
ncbi:hypothetical protein Gogos_004738 [Gossypium gossypioides]|uniref:Protein kinase domain-containing protein n=1 Tax=Gossypium gossypioides TaxID=34282 RepID=A0A7J9CHC6_GOSGO|nr:hypothetical protein [Gossypium gossypioides]